MSSSNPSAYPAERDGPASAANKVSRVLRGSVTTISTTSSNFVNRHVPPQKRQQWKQRLTEFAARRPYLAGFLLSQLAISIVPVLLLTLFAFFFALTTGILLGALGAFLFVTFVMGLASLVLLPMLFFTSGAAVLIWFWGSVAIFVITRLQRKDREGRPADGRPQQQHTPPKTPTTTSSLSPHSPTSNDPPRTPTSRSPSPDPGVNRPRPSEDHPEGHTPQVQPERLEPTRTLSPPTNDVLAGEQRVDERAAGLQSSHPGAQTASPNSVPDGATSAQAQTDIEGGPLSPG